MGLFTCLKFWRTEKSKKSGERLSTDKTAQEVVLQVVEDIMQEVEDIIQEVEDKKQEEAAQKKLRIEQEVVEKFEKETLALKEELNKLRGAYVKKEVEMKNLQDQLKELENLLEEEQEQFSEIYELAIAPTFSGWQKAFFVVSGTVIILYQLLAGRNVWRLW